jgi:hypothetical protein
MLIAVIDSPRANVSATDGAEVAPASGSTWLSVRRQTLWEACRRHRTGSSSDGLPFRHGSFYGMLVASDISRHAPSVPLLQ